MGLAVPVEDPLTLVEHKVKSGVVYKITCPRCLSCYRADFKDFLPVGTSFRREAIYVGTFYYFLMDFPMIIRSPRKVQKIRRNVGTIQVDAFQKLRANTPAALSKFSRVYK